MPHPVVALASHIPPRLIGSLVVLGIAGIVWLVVKLANAGSKPAAMPMPTGGAPFCAACGTQGVWFAGGNFFNCPRCQRPVTPIVGQAPAGVAQIAQPPQPPGIAPACPRCGGMGRWMPEVGAWGCDTCRQGITTGPQMTVA